VVEAVAPAAVPAGLEPAAPQFLLIHQLPTFYT
jgi:hypothetical protein